MGFLTEFIYDLYRVLSDKIYLSFIKEDRYMYLVNGWVVSIEITAFAAIIGIVIGVLLAIAKIMKKPPLTQIADWYVSVIRGTPVVVQLTIIYYVILANSNLPKIIVASIAFGINSGAYVAEIIRSGIQAVDRGQTEAGRSLGLSYGQTMRFIILPQAIKNILPALGNEFITLIKETSVASVIAVTELTKAAQYIGSRTWDILPPLIIAALCYLAMVMGLSKLLSVFERRMAKGDRH